MWGSIKKLLMFLHLVINHGISPSTIFHHKGPFTTRNSGERNRS